ncbi:MAG: hypothetical protein A3B38_04570 [Candidatus Levybacteria bacterium RIFCSPLOWO2_01_FULL_36_13]|nr:MAG: hypothetical protein A2684_00320 [Candidatus Levybacteria bacterium RIFCSPHIGHO2_01_FULL_36_15b]OGH34101.1 MAG: hypothetical protein A3B38_04570 [Candidatus Levybacteria bacterium RIFCSPLOWO2_01_FULL_36_13]
MGKIEVRDRSIRGRIKRDKFVMPQGSLRKLSVSRTNVFEGDVVLGEADIFNRYDDENVNVRVWRGEQNVFSDEPAKEYRNKVVISDSELQKGVRLPSPFEYLEVRNARKGAFSRLRRKLSRRSQ